VTARHRSTAHDRGVTAQRYAPCRRRFRSLGSARRASW
jgi:hypothetical protein